MSDPKDPKTSPDRPRVARSNKLSKTSGNSTAGDPLDQPIGRPITGGDKGFTQGLILRLASMTDQFRMAKLLPMGTDGKAKTDSTDLRLFWFIRNEWETNDPFHIRGVEFHGFSHDPDMAYRNFQALGVTQNLAIADIAAFQWAHERQMEAFFSQVNRYTEPN